MINGTPYLKQHKEKHFFFTEGDGQEIGRINVEVGILSPPAFVLLKQGNSEGDVWHGSYGSMQESQCNHTPVASRRIQNIAGESERKEKKVREREKSGSAGQTELTTQCQICSILCAPADIFARGNRQYALFFSA